MWVFSNLGVDKCLTKTLDAASIGDLRDLPSKRRRRHDWRAPQYLRHSRNVGCIVEGNAGPRSWLDTYVFYLDIIALPGSHYRYRSQRGRSLPWQFDVHQDAVGFCQAAWVQLPACPIIAADPSNVDHALGPFV